MNLMLRCRLLWTLPLGAAAVVVAYARHEPPPAMRFVAATITCDGLVVLRGSTADNGEPDADEVWSYLRTLEFAPAEGFAQLGEPATGAQWVVAGPRPASGEPPTARFVVEVAYGGRLLLRELVLVPAGQKAGDHPAGPGSWRLAPEEVQRWFRHRWISRDQAASLREPKRLK